MIHVKDLQNITHFVVVWLIWYVVLQTLTIHVCEHIHTHTHGLYTAETFSLRGTCTTDSKPLQTLWKHRRSQRTFSQSWFAPFKVIFFHTDVSLNVHFTTRAPLSDCYYTDWLQMTSTVQDGNTQDGVKLYFWTMEHSGNLCQWLQSCE